MNHQMASSPQLHDHNLQQVSTMVQSEYLQGHINTGGSHKPEREGHTVSQLSDAQSAHLLTTALPKAAVG